jgi:hypothetical protein
MEHASDAPAYGLWSLVAINSLVFIIFAFSDAYPPIQESRSGFLSQARRRPRRFSTMKEKS